MTTKVNGTIKTLVWVSSPKNRVEDWIQQAMVDAYCYEVGLDDDGWWWQEYSGDFKDAFETIEAAKSAAQADYEARILAQIDPAPEVQLVDDCAPDLRCNQCGWHGCDDDLVASIDTEDGRTSRPCPDCGTDNYLMDGPWSHEIHVADQVKSRLYARAEGYKAGFNAALRSGRAGASADLLLTAYDSLMRGETISPEQKELSDRVALAACYGAAAFTSGMDEDQGTHAMARSFLLALIDPLHEELDYLRADPATAKAVREGRALTEAGQ